MNEPMPPRDALPTRTPGATFDHQPQTPPPPAQPHMPGQWAAQVSAMYNTRNDK